MSVLRLLSPSGSRSGSPARSLPGASSSSSSSNIVAYKKESSRITLQLRLPTFGSIFMNPPDDPLWPHARSEGPRDDQLLSGVLEVHIPRAGAGGTAKRRCKSVRVGVRTKCRLNMGPGRGWEEDTIFERKVELMGGNSDGIILDEGIQRFEFTLILPSTFSPHDWHHNGKVTQELFAELEGLPEPESSALSLFGFGRRRESSRGSFSTSRRGSYSSPSGSHMPSGSPSPSASPRLSPTSLSPMLTAAASFSITRQEELEMPLVPSYEQSQADPYGQGAGSAQEQVPKQGDDWIVGTIQEVRSIMVMHNPNPTGNFTDLDLRQSGVAPGIGVWDLKIFSDVFSIGGPIHARLTLPSLNPKTTIFSWRLLVRQTHTITSPRDDPELVKPHSSSRLFSIIERGVKPDQGVRRPGLGHAAVWRGKESGGDDEGECMISGTAYMPKDDRGRPTTLPGIITPIKVSHVLVYEVYFSVWGEDDRGELLPEPGPGGLRFLQVTKPLILPSCALIPALLDLPMYTQSQSSPNEPCTTCGKTCLPTNQLCTLCPETAVPHARHDYETRKITIGDGYCVACCQRYNSLATGGWSLPTGWDLCACGLDAGDIVTRMKRFATEGIRADGDGPGEEEREARRVRKECDERGRGRSMERERSR